MTTETSRLKVGINSILFTGLVLLALIIINVIFEYSRRVRWDITEDGMYSLSPVSKKMVKGLKSELRVRLFVSKKLVRGLDQVKTYVMDFLEQYEAASNGKFKWELIDPAESKSNREMAEKYNIKRVPYATGGRDKSLKSAREVYFGIAMTYKRAGAPKVGIETIAHVNWDNQKNLEYMLTERIRRLTRGRRKILVVSGHNELPRQMKQKAMEGLGKLFKTFEVVDYNIKGKQPVPKDAAVALVINPNAPWGAPELAKLDQIIMQGVGALFMLEGLAVQRQRQPLPAHFGQILMAHQHGLNRLLKRWGIEVQGNVVLDQGQRPIPIQIKGPIYQMVHHPALLNIEHGRVHVNPFRASSLKLTAAYLARKGKKPPPGVKFNIKVLLTSSSRGWTQKPPYVANNRRREEPPKNARRGAFPVGAVAEGILPSAFVKPGTGDGAMRRAATPGKTRIAVIGDVNLLFFALGGVADKLPGNKIFLQNLVDWLAQQEDLVKLRNKQIRTRSLVLPKSKGRRLFIKIANVVTLPLLLIIFAILRRQFRKIRRERAEDMIA